MSAAAPLVVSLGATSSLYKDWRRRGEESLLSPGAVVFQEQEESTAVTGSSTVDEDVLTDKLCAEASARAEDDGRMDSEAVVSARAELEASARRLAAAEAKRASAESALRQRSSSIGREIAACQAIAMGGGLEEDVYLSSLQAREQQLRADLEALEEDDTGEQECHWIAAAVGGCRITLCRATETCVEVVFALGDTQLGVVLNRPSLRLESAHLAHDVVDVADLVDAAAREQPPNDVRLLIRETRARIRQLEARKDLAKSLKATKVHATDDFHRLTVLESKFTATFVLPRNFPDHPHLAAPRLDSLSLVCHAMMISHPELPFRRPRCPRKSTPLDSASTGLLPAELQSPRFLPP